MLAATATATTPTPDTSHPPRHAVRDPDLLVIEFTDPLASVNYLDLARLHGLNLDQLVAFLEHPDTQRTITGIERLNALRARVLTAASHSIALHGLSQVAFTPTADAPAPKLESTRKAAADLARLTAPEPLKPTRAQRSGIDSPSVGLREGAGRRAPARSKRHRLTKTLAGTTTAALARSPKRLRLPPASPSPRHPALPLAAHRPPRSAATLLKRLAATQNCAAVNVLPTVSRSHVQLAPRLAS